MPITINGAGSIVGISAGGLPDASIVTADIADGNITPAKLSGAQSGSAPVYGCRAWVNFDGTRNEADTGASTNGANVKIRASGNVSSVLKNGTGDYTITFTTAMPDANYSLIVNTSDSSGNTTSISFLRWFTASPTTSASRIGTTNDAGAAFDTPFTCVAVFR